MDKILLLLGGQREIDEKLLKEAPIPTIKHYLRILHSRLFRMEVLLISTVLVEFINY